MRNRITTMLMVSAVLASLVALVGPTGAATHPAPNPPTVTRGHGGTGSLTFHKPGSSTCYVTAQTNLHQGYNGPVDADADAVRPAGAVRHGPCALRTAVVELRVGFENGQRFRDFRPSKSDVNSNNGLLPADTLNSALDYSPDTHYVAGWGDWVKVTCADPKAASRMVFQVRWTDGLLTTFSFRGSNVVHDQNGCPVITPGPSADLDVDNIASIGSASGSVPANYNYTLSVVNHDATDNATSVSLEMPWPIELENPTSLPPNCAFLLGPETLQCNFGTVVAGDTEFVVIAVTTDPEAFNDTVITNTATVSSPTPDPVPGNNSATETILVDCQFSQATLNNRPDSGEDGNTWALDTMTRTTRICEGVPGQYSVKVSDNGTFNPISGEKTPDGDDLLDVILDDAPNGTIVGSFHTRILAAPNFSTYTTAGMTGSHSGTAPSSSGTWAGRFFTDVADPHDSTFAQWKWTYSTCAETYVQANTGYVGDIEGLACLTS